MPNTEEVYISVDIETAGPYPSEYSLLAIGACLVEDLSVTFYAELQPTTNKSMPEALAISQLSLEELKKSGQPPTEVMQRFDQWIGHQLSEDQRPVFVAFNAPFDWMFINEYFHRYLERNPFGHSALDMKAFFMGLRNSDWSETSMKNVTKQYAYSQELTHNALQDAQDQARIFQAMLEEARLSKDQKGIK